MACYGPIAAFQSFSTGEVFFSERRNCRSLSLPCGQCIGCRLERSRQWAMRIMHEAKGHGKSSFVTLTYDDDHLPADGSLRYRDVQLFLKRLRKSGPLRFVCAGEYGSESFRPHYHVCFFGYYPEDAKWCGGEEEHKLYSSESLDSVWSHGATRTGALTFESAAYVARYIVDKVTGAMAEGYYSRVDPVSGEVYDLMPEFLRMSLKPGIGFQWYMDNVISPRAGLAVDGPLAKGKCVVNGHLVRQPKAYDRWLKSLDGTILDSIQFARLAGFNHDDATPERLRARAVVARARMERSSRRGDQ